MCASWNDGPTPRKKARPSVAGQGGWAWLARHAGPVAISAAWACVFAGLSVAKATDMAVAVLELAVAGAALMGFGISWIVRDEIGRGDAAQPSAEREFL